VKNITAAVIMGIVLAAIGICLIVRSIGFQDLKATIIEARLVREDLNHMLEKSLDISREIVNNIDGKIAEGNTREQLCEDDIASDIQSPPEDNGNEIRKIRIYELARRLGISSNELLERLKAMGYPWNNPLNTLDEQMAATIQERLEHQDETLSDIQPDQPDNYADEAEPGDTTESSPEPGPDKVEEMDTWINELKEAHPYLAVKTLADRGYTTREIAQMLNRGQGEVSLILNLVNKKRA
jgi:hypothetical protein